jgi:hypothetical protein
MLRDRAIGVVFAISAADWIAPSSLSSQARLELTPLLGWYLPTTSIAKQVADPHCGGIAQAAALRRFRNVQASAQFPDADCGAVLNQRTGPAVGGRLTGWVTTRVALDLAVSYVLSGVVAYPPDIGEGGFDLDMPGHLATGSARVLFTFGPQRSPNGFYVACGAAFVSHRGPAYVDLTAQRLGSAVAPSNVAWGGDAAVGFRFSEQPDRVELRMELEDFVYRFSGEVNPVGTSYPGYLQNDLVFSLGVVVRLLGPGGWIR